MTDKAKDKIRNSTRRHFKKKGICSRCGAEDKPTTWHHKVYNKNLSRRDIEEVCKPCHRYLEYLGDRYDG